ncbi:hypothetical protein EBT16_02495 [bacterium]|nr:hypothetical protein [bacterium]
MNKESIRKLEWIFREKFAKSPGDDSSFIRIRWWDKFLVDMGCHFLYKGYLVEPVEHPKGFILISDPIRCRSVAVPEELAIKALMFGEIP